MLRLAGVEHGPRLVRVPFECREGGVGFADGGLAEEFDAVVCCGGNVSKVSLSIWCEGGSREIEYDKTYQHAKPYAYALPG